MIRRLVDESVMRNRRVLKNRDSRDVGVVTPVMLRLTIVVIVEIELIDLIVVECGARVLPLAAVPRLAFPIPRRALAQSYAKVSIRDAKPGPPWAVQRLWGGTGNPGPVRDPRSGAAGSVDRPIVRERARLWL